MKEAIQLLTDAEEALSPPIYHNNLNGADWIECRACNATERQIAGAYHPIKHYPDCVLVRIQQFLQKTEEDETKHTDG